MKKYEYKNFYLMEIKGCGLLDEINSEGKKGWELVSINKLDVSSDKFPCALEYRGIMKREIAHYEKQNK
jgi:hypothetical protein